MQFVYLLAYIILMLVITYDNELKKLLKVVVDIIRMIAVSQK